MSKKRKVIHIRIQLPVHEDLKNLSDYRNCSMNWIVEQALVEKLERERRYFDNNQIPKQKP